MPFTVVLAGRPNVGKSTLFNRLAGRRLALVSDKPGLTRDRREAEIEIGDFTFRLVDTAGLDEGPSGTLPARMSENSERTIAEADLCLFLIDARVGITQADVEYTARLRRGRTPVILIANKCEGRAGHDGFYEAFELGLGDPISISAEHGQAIGDLIDAVCNAAATHDSGDEDGDTDKPLRLVVIGRPNAGKSTLINRLIGSERMLAGPEAGITRDAISIDWNWKGKPVRLFDTAGLRRRSRVGKQSELLARNDALRAIRFAEVVVLLVDSRQALDKQDLHLADLVAEEGRALVIAANKGDLVGDGKAYAKALREAADNKLSQVRGAPIVLISALEEWGLDALLDESFAVAENWNRRISTGELNRWFSEIIDRHPPPAVAGRRIRMRYITQASSRPPTFIVFCSRPDAIPGSYRRYIVNELRAAFDLPGVPVRIHLRKGRNPHVSNSL